MPVIINGEVVPDNDPRAIARRGGGGNNARNRAAQSRNRFGTIGGGSTRGSSSRPNVSRQPAGTGAGNSSNPLASLEKMIGVEGKTFNVPAIMGNPSIDMPVIILFILAFLCILTNWRVGAGGLLLCYLYYTNQVNQSQGAATGGR